VASEPEPHAELRPAVRDEHTAVQPHQYRSVPRRREHLRTITRLFQPGELNGVQNPVFARNKIAAPTDWLNLAPRVGFAWTPHFESGLLATLFGKGDETVIRGGWDITYFDEGTNMFASTAGNNTGQSQALVAAAERSSRRGA
jgi:hypothetical protein